MLFSYKGGFGIKWPMTVDMPLNKEINLNLIFGKLTILNRNNLQLYGIKESYQIRIILYRSIWPIDGIQTSTNFRGQIGPGSNGSEGVIHITQNFRTKTSLSVKYPKHSSGGS